MTYDGTNDVTAWVIPTLTGIAGKPAPTGSVTISYYQNGNLLSAAPVVPGSYSVLATYGGDANYAAEQSNTVPFTIGQATPTLLLTPGPAVIKYDGTADETVWAKTVLTGVPNALVPTDNVTINYYAGTTTGGTPLSSPPIAVGTYTAVATSASDLIDLSATSSPVTFTISATTGATPLPLSGPALYLRLDADGKHLDIWNATTDTGSPAQTVLLSNVSAIAVTGVSTGTTLTVDFAAGDPLVASGLRFNGASGVTNTLNVTDAGDAANTSFNIDALNVDVTTPASTTPVTYANLTAINITPGTGTDVLTQLAQLGTALSFLNTTSLDSLNIVNGTYTISAGQAGAGFHAITLGSLALDTGAKVVVADAAAHSDRTVLILGSLSIAGSPNALLGQLNLGGNDLIVHNGNLPQITSLLASGYDLASGANWSGRGISSSTAGSDTTDLTALGVELNNDGKGNRLFGNGTATGLFDNQNTVLTDVLVKYTYFGDANLDGKVDGTDYARLDTGSASDGVLTGWANGDFNYDGVIDGTDFGLIDQAFNEQRVSF